MVRFGFVAAISAACFASAANAEGYVELRGGIAASPDYTTEAIGLALGYDADLGSAAFVGAELTADTNASFDTPVYGFNLRLGAKANDTSKLFGTLGVARYSYDGYIVGPSYYAYYSGWDTDVVAGVGYQRKIGENARLSVQYQRYFDTKYNRGSIGLGFGF
ncbi:MAG: hypothetical protein RL764_543 [Pseudomonadota bacterium]